MHRHTKSTDPIEGKHTSGFWFKKTKSEPPSNQQVIASKTMRDNVPRYILNAHRWECTDPACLYCNPKKKEKKKKDEKKKKGKKVKK